MPFTIGRRAPISSCVISSTRRCSSNVHDATSDACAFVVMRRRPGDRGDVAQVSAVRGFVDGEIFVEWQQHRGDDPLRDVVAMA